MADIKHVDAIIDKWNEDPEYVIEMMQDIQDQFRHIPRKALERVADRTGKPRGKLFHIATFYKAFSLEPRGETEIQVCMGTACYVKGAPDILAAMEDGLRKEEIPDLTLRSSGCGGLCSSEPQVTVRFPDGAERIFLRVTEDRAGDLLDMLREDRRDGLEPSISAPPSIQSRCRLP